jgi:hypothetical protein
LKFLFDNNLSPHLAHGIAKLCAGETGAPTVEHLRDRFPPATPDGQWIENLAASGGDWYILSIDKFRKSRGAEREALRRAGFTVYVLDPQWAKHSYWKVAAQMVAWWPQILQHARLTSSGVYRIQWKPSQGHRFAAY